jgi:hypothetical protein
LVAGQIVAAVEPAALEASLAAVAEVERERAELPRHGQLRLERACYESEGSCRQFQACEPENRLVARELERRGQEALRQQRQREEEFARWQRTTATRLSASDRDAIRELAADLPAVWQAETTTPADRQRIARLLLERPASLARKLGATRDTVRRWLRVGWLSVRRDADGHHIIWADASEIRRLRELHRLPRPWANRGRLAQSKMPKKRPTQ